MDNRIDIAQLLADLDSCSPAGFAIALHVKFTAPAFLFQTYPVRWIEIYTQQGLVLKDPTVKWGFNNRGAIRWRDLAEDDAAGVLDMAKSYGLLYGVTMAVAQDSARSMASFSRSDRDYLDAEIDDLHRDLTALHNQTAGLDELSEDVMLALKRMSIRLTHN